MMKYRLLPLFLIFFSAPPLYADMALLLHQPFGAFGFFNPTGHSALYLSRVCAESPVRLRRCNESELGVVISRYDRIAGYDWVAIPFIPFLYAVDHPEQVPDFIDRAGVMALRDAWRRNNLRGIISYASGDSDAEDDSRPKGHWKQLVGAAYDRKIYGFMLETDEAADDALIEMLNSRANKRRFNMLFRNCADFTKDIINFYHPKSVRRNIIADIGLTTPKQVSKSFVRISERNPNLRFSAFMIPQIHGEIARSSAVRGVAETFVLSKQYIVPLVVFAPWVAVSGVAAYLTEGRFNPENHASMVLEPFELIEYLSAFSEHPPDEPPVYEASEGGSPANEY